MRSLTTRCCLSIGCSAVYSPSFGWLYSCTPLGNLGSAACGCCPQEQVPCGYFSHSLLSTLDVPSTGTIVSRENPDLSTTFSPACAPTLATSVARAPGSPGLASHGPYQPERCP